MEQIKSGTPFLQSAAFLYGHIIKSYSNFKSTAQKPHYFALKLIELREQLFSRDVTCQGSFVQKSCQLQKWSSTLGQFDPIKSYFVGQLVLL